MTTNTTKTLKEIAGIIKELKEFQEMKKSLEAEIDELKAECIEYMVANEIDEVNTSEGKVTYREVLSKRLDSTQFKKDYLALYEAYLKITSSMRFTCN